MFPVLRTVLLNQRVHILKTFEILYLNRIAESLNRSFSYCITIQHSSVTYKGVWKPCPIHLLKICDEAHFQKRFYAKGKDKGKGGKLVRSHITEEELAELINIEDFKGEMDRAMEQLKEEYVHTLSLRSSLGSLEALPVEFEGDTYPLSEIAQVIRKSPTMVIVQATAFPQASPNIKKSIEESGMNLNPQQDGTTFFIPIPKVTKEHREGLAQSAKTICDKTKTYMKDIQNKYIKKLKAKNGAVSEDLIFNAQVKIREITQANSLLAETLMKNKQNELLKTTK